jgi:hypothetical protein
MRVYNACPGQMDTDFRKTTRKPDNVKTPPKTGPFRTLSHYAGASGDDCDGEAA